jgi:integrase
MSSIAQALSTQVHPGRQNSQLPKYLHRRGKSFYFKRRIPTDVADDFPHFKGQVWKSLDTDNLAKARVYLAVELTEFELTVANLRRAQALAVAKDMPEQSKRVPFSIVRRIKSAVDKAPVSSEEKFTVAIEGRTAERLTASSTGAAEQTPLSSTTLGQNPAKLSGSKKGVGTATSAAGTHVIAVTAKIAPTMSHLFEDWKQKQTRQRTINAVHTVVMEFRTLNGHIAVDTLQKHHVRGYRDYLIARHLSKRTVENRLGFLSTLMRHGMREMVEQLTFNPFENIDVIGATGLRKPKDRRAYAVSELNSIFSSRLYTEGYRPDGQTADAAYWVPIIGPFVGARIEEVCQLRIEDVQRVNGVWCVRICDLGMDQNVKNTSSFRRVPLHEMVIKSGFLVYAARMAKAGHDRLFPTLTNDNANGIYSNSVGKWYGRYLESIGLTDHRLDYHSFRYTFRQQCSLCGVENEVRDALTGHWLNKNDSGRAYMKGENRQYPFPKLTVAIQQLRYEELKLLHIFVDEPMEGVEAALLR